MGHLESHGRLMKEFHSGKFLLSFDGKLDLYVKRYIFVTVHWQYPAKRVAVNSNIFSYRHDIMSAIIKIIFYGIYWQTG